MNSEHEREKIAAFIKAGLVGLCALVLVAAGIYYLPGTISTMTGLKNEKKLPIYCVDQKDKKVSLSFDAAWGGS